MTVSKDDKENYNPLPLAYFVSPLSRSLATGLASIVLSGQKSWYQVIFLGKSSPHGPSIFHFCLVLQCVRQLDPSTRVYL